MKLVTVVTPTWHRPEQLYKAMVSVQLQTYPLLEHRVVSDGPDKGFARDMDACVDWFRPVIWGSLPDHREPHDLGSRARNHAIQAAAGEYVAFLDDDNIWRPNHVQVLVRAMHATDADFAYSQGLFHMTAPTTTFGAEGYEMVVGMDPPRHGQIDTSLIMCRRELVQAFPWPSPCSRASDWELVHRWIREGARWAFVPEVTMDYYLQPTAAKT